MGKVIDLSWYRERKERDEGLVEIRKLDPITYEQVDGWKQLGQKCPEMVQ